MVSIWIKRLCLAMFALPLCLAGTRVGAASAGNATYGQQVVAAVLMAEAWSEGEAAMTAVAEVIRERADRDGKSPLAVVMRRHQFTCLNRTDPRSLIRKYWQHPDFQIALRIARQMYNEPATLPGHAKGATHFERIGTRAHWTRGLTPVARHGNLAFYRLPY